MSEERLTPQEWAGMSATTHKSILDEPLGVSCPGCGVDLTCRNAGGYRCYCAKCVDAMPTFPTDGHGYVIEGTYPNFKWVTPADGEIPTRAVNAGAIVNTEF